MGEGLTPIFFSADSAVSQKVFYEHIQDAFCYTKHLVFCNILSNKAVWVKVLLKFMLIRLQAKLEKKHDDRLTTYFEEFMAMCRKVCGKETEEDRRKFGDKGKNSLFRVQTEYKLN